MRKVTLQSSVGMALAHDIVRIVPGAVKEVAFRRGHTVREEDLEPLRRLGKRHLFVWEDVAGEVHENEGAARLARALGGAGLEVGRAAQGRADLLAVGTGLLRVDASIIDAVNAPGALAVATRPDYEAVAAGERVAGCRVIPLTVSEAALRRAEQMGPALRVLAYRPLRTALVTTGSEVARGLVRDGFLPVVLGKLQPFGAPLIGQYIVDDDEERIAATILTVRDEGAELILVTGGLAVDPDDVTADGVARAGAVIETHGAPVLPGSVLLMAYLGDVPVMGLPAGVLKDTVTLFDRLLPRVMAGERVSGAAIRGMGVGGLL